MIIMTDISALNAPTEQEIITAVDRLREARRTEATGPEIYELCWPGVSERVRGAKDLSYLSVLVTLRKLAAEGRFALSEPDGAPACLTFPA